MLIEEQQNEIDELILRYTSGKADRKTLNELKRRAKASDTVRRYIRQRLEISFSTGVAGSTKAVDKDAAFRRFLRRIGNENSVKKMKRSMRRKWWTRVAAVALILLLPIYTYYQGEKKMKDSFTDMVVEAPMGSRTKLCLPDGTWVWLNAASRIIYSQGFGVSDRYLKLEGEGYFEVAKNEKLPFEISTREVKLRVTGTKFNFKNYSDDEEVIVNLMEGEVTLRNEIRPMSELYLKPTEKMIMDKRTGMMRKVRASVSNANVWTKDELFFDEELLEDIANKLMRNYDVRIEIADSLRNRRFYGSFKLGSNTIDEVLQTIASTKRMKYRYENEKYIIY